MSHFTPRTQSAFLPVARLVALLLILLVVQIAPVSFVQASNPAQTQQMIGIVRYPVVNVRAGDGTNYARVGQLYQGDRVTVNARNSAGTWLQICCVATDQEGWVSAEMISLRWADDPNSNPQPTVQPTAIPQSVSPPDPNVVVIPAPEWLDIPTPIPPTPVIIAAPLPTYTHTEGINPLTGLGLPVGLSNQRPLIVCVNNDYAARPQFGLSQADVVYEYLMEGYSITRFSAIFYSEEVVRIGPVRSARIINQQLATLYNGLTACSGASDAVRYMMRQQSPAPYVDFDLDDPAATRYVVSIGRDYRTRMRTSTAMLRRYLADTGLEQTADHLRGFSFGRLIHNAPPATTISIPYPSSVSVEYQYDAESQHYLRWLAGKPHQDGNNGQQIAAENVVIQFATHENTEIIEDSLGSRSIRINLIGSGPSIVMRDGQAFKGTWRSDGSGDTPHFYDAASNEVLLKPGRTWISIVPLTYQIRYQ